MPDVELSPSVRALAQRFRLEEGRVFLTEPDLEAARAEVVATPIAERRPRALELVALASKLHRMGGESSALAVSQLAELAATLVDPSTLAHLFKDVGLPELRVERLVGTDTARRAPRHDDKIPAGTIKAGSLAGPRRRG